jgi:hypothetical protein
LDVPQPQSPKSILLEFPEPALAKELDAESALERPLACENKKVLNIILASTGDLNAL